MRRRGIHRDAMNGGIRGLKCAPGGSGVARRCWMAAGGGLFADGLFAGRFSDGRI